MGTWICDCAECECTNEVSSVLKVCETCRDYCDDDDDPDDDDDGEAIPEQEAA